MNTRFMCDNCGSQPCMCQTFECPVCDGHGECDRQHLRPQMIECDTCKGTGELRCDGPAPKTMACPYDALGAGCHCEAAWERQQESIASEPPMSADEQHQRAYRERQALRSGIPL